MASDRFYEELPAFTDFKEVTGDKPFRPLPSDWKVIVADIEGSTSAIDGGRYKDVNTIGAATSSTTKTAATRWPPSS